MGYKVYKGAPYFAVDVTPKGTIASQARDVIEAMKQRDLFFDTSRTPTSFPPDQAAIFAQGRHLIDWNDRYTFCGTCGSKLMSTQAGTKRVCPTRDAALIASGVSQDGATPECSSRARVSNVCFPRTDPTIIVAVLSHDGKRMLLGRQARWPEKWYSTLAGFVEPAESIEDAVRREVWEESGVRVARVVIHSSQPWPFPECLMIGAIAQVGRVEDETVHLEHDAELQDARWYPLAEVEEALRIGTGPLDAGPNPEYQGGLRLPGSIAIANRLMTAVVEGDFWKAKI
ncbi:NADH pyrophosphatase [Ascosphaera atra]|nr:NADH pyrophosphatase [Ascosphaera atra]